MTTPDEIRQLLQEADPVAFDALDDHDSARLFSAIVRRRDTSPGSDTMLDTDRRQPETRIPRRRGLRPAFVFSGAAIVALTVLVPILMMGSGDEDVADEATITTAPVATTTTATPGPAPLANPVMWERLPDQESLKWAFFGPTVEFDGRLVSVGQVPEEGYGPGDRDWASDGAVWVSDDGVDWARLEIEGLDGYGSQTVEDLLVGSDGLIAIGDTGAGPAGTYDLAVWTSPDATVWTEVANLGTVDIGEIFETDDGWLIVGTDRRTGAAAWTSPDLVTWTRISDPDFDSVGPDGTTTYLEGAARTPSGFLAVGFDGGGDEFLSAIDGYSSCAAAWFSVDGLAWERLDTETLCQMEGILWAVFEVDGRWYAEGGNMRDLWMLTDPADPTTWVEVDPTPVGLETICPLRVDPRTEFGRRPRGTEAWIGETGIQAVVAAQTADEARLRDSGAYCATTDGGATWAAYEADVLAGRTVEIEAAISWKGRFIVVGQETVSAVGLPGQGAVWVGTPTE